MGPADIPTTPRDDATVPSRVAVTGAGDPPDLGERYRIGERLGEGGMGVVWQAHDRTLDRTVAVKVLHDRYLGADDQARLVAEARSMARLSHPNVVSVYDVAERDGRTFLIMELVRGQPLGAWLKTPRSWRAIVEVFLAVADGLAAAHDAGLIHRDVKPGNLLVGDDGRARIADFGVAHAGQSVPVAGEAPALVTTVTEGVIGTPAYMAPEQLRGEPADAAGDQFGLCASLYEALAGRRPFAGATTTAL
ncbi:MAG: serine/threonine protein kinase, partial [Myxococcales bacterium]|nr:serine/threonine protein kinase [Myxococcales bacterium]